MTYKLDHMSIMTSFYAVDTYGISLCGIAGATTIEVMHRETGV